MPMNREEAIRFGEGAVSSGARPREIVIDLMDAGVSEAEARQIVEEQVLRIRGIRIDLSSSGVAHKVSPPCPANPEPVPGRVIIRNSASQGIIGVLGGGGMIVVGAFLIAMALSGGTDAGAVFVFGALVQDQATFCLSGR